MKLNIKTETVPFDYLPPQGTEILFDLVKQKKLHFACPALTGDSIAMQLLEKFFGVHQAITFIDRVNRQNHTGCFHPQLTLTIYPALQKDKNAEEVMRKIMDDILEANEEHFKTETLHVITEAAAGYNSDEFLACLKQKLQNPPKEIKALKQVLFTTLT